MTNQDWINQTIKTWQPYYAEELTQQDAEDMIANWSAFIAFISETLVAKEQLEKRNQLGGTAPVMVE